MFFRISRISGLFLIFGLTSIAAEAQEFLVLESPSVLSPEKLEQVVEKLAPYIDRYPPKFDSEEQAKEIIEFSQRVVDELSAGELKVAANSATMTNLAFFLAMAHNIDLGTAPSAYDMFEQALKLDPESRRANYLFGMFLTRTARWRFDGLPYLEKALELGEVHAKYTIGLIYVQLGEKEKGLSILEEYATDFPDSNTNKLIDGIKSGRVKFFSSDD